MSIYPQEDDTVAVVIDTDQWIGSTDGWRPDFTEVIGFPFNDGTAHTTSGGMINTTRAVLANGVSAHYTRQSLSFAQLERFLEHACKLVPDKTKYNIV